MSMMDDTGLLKDEMILTPGGIVELPLVIMTCMRLKGWVLMSALAAIAVTDSLAIDEVIMIDQGHLMTIKDSSDSVVFASSDRIGLDEEGRAQWAHAFGDGRSEISPFEVGEDGKLFR